MLVTLLGMITEVRLLHLEKAKSPMDVALLGMLTEVRLEQLENTELLMDVIPLGMTRSFISFPFTNKR